MKPRINFTQGDIMSQEQIEVTEETTEVIDAVETEPEAIEHESAEDSVRRAIEELTKEPEEKATEANAQEAQPEEKTESQEAKTNDSKVVADKLEPPTRWTVEAKEWFNKQPTEYKREIVRQNSDFESHSTKLWQEINRQKSRYDGIDQIVKKYGEEWNLKGVSDVAAIAELAATEQALRKDPEGTLARLIKALRVDPEKLLGKVTGKESASENNSASPEVLALRAELNEIKNWKQGLASNYENQAAESVAQEIREVQNLQDSNGRYIYPQLHDSDFLARVKPFVTAAKEAQPGISWGEATKRGYQALQSINGSPSLQPAKLPGQTQPNTNKSRARLVSVAGQSSGSGSLGGMSLEDVKIPKSAEDTARLVMQMLRR
jgi:hypothetical protein